MTRTRSTPVRSVFHPIEGGTTEHDGASGTEHRNMGGTPSLLTLAALALFGRTAEQPAEQPAEQACSTPPEQAEVIHRQDRCPHVAEDWLADWYAAHPELTCARCWLAAHPRRLEVAR
jgi:hypothetical protein